MSDNLVESAGNEQNEIVDNQDVARKGILSWE